MIADATTLILLAKADVLEIFVEKNNIIIPPIVYKEVLKGKEKSRIDAFIIEKLVQEKKIKVKIPQNATKKIIQHMFNMQGGELEVIALAYNTQDTVLNDDKKGIHAAKALKLNFIGSLGVVVALQHAGRINKKEALEAIDILQAYGWYDPKLIKTHKEALQ